MRAERQRFSAAVTAFVADLQAGRQPRPGLRVYRLANHDGLWSLAWAPGGRATFAYGPEIRPGEPHIIWRRIGTHAVYGNS